MYGPNNERETVEKFSRHKIGQFVFYSDVFGENYIFRKKPENEVLINYGSKTKNYSSGYKE